MSDGNEKLFNPEGTNRTDDLMAAFGQREIMPGRDYHPVSDPKRILHVDAEFHQSPPPPAAESPQSPATSREQKPESRPASTVYDDDEPRAVVSIDEYDIFDQRERRPRSTGRAYVTQDGRPLAIGERKRRNRSTMAVGALTCALALVSIPIYDTVIGFPWENSSQAKANGASSLKAPNVVSRKRQQNSLQERESPSVDPSPSIETTPTTDPSTTAEPAPTELPTELTPPALLPGETVVTIPPTDIRIGSLNIFHSDDQEASVWKEDRLRKSVNAIKGLPADTEWFKPLDPTKALAVAGLQEVRPNQQAAFLKDNFGGKDYDMYPRLDRNEFFSPNPIIWQKSLFDLVKTDAVRLRYFNGDWQDSPIALLQSKVTGEKFWYMDVHYPADVFGEADMYRHENDQIILQKVVELQQSGNSKDEADAIKTPVILVGDFNTTSAYTGQEMNNPYENTPKNLSVCALTATGILKDAYSELNMPDVTPENCGETVPELNAVVHAFATEEFTILSYEASKGPEQVGSDVHSLHVIDMQLPGREEVVQATPATTEIPTVPELAVPSVNPFEVGPTTVPTPTVIDRDTQFPMPTNGNGGKRLVIQSTPEHSHE